MAQLFVLDVFPSMQDAMENSKMSEMKKAVIEFCVLTLFFSIYFPAWAKGSSKIFVQYAKLRDLLEGKGRQTIWWETMHVFANAYFDTVRYIYGRGVPGSTDQSDSSHP